VETEKKIAHERGFLIDEQAVKRLSFRLIRGGRKHRQGAHRHRYTEGTQIEH